MSTRSTNLDLELQAAGERASLNILNSNLGKIDEFAGKATKGIGVNNLGGIATFDAFKSAFDSVLNDTPSNGFITFTVTATAAFEKFRANQSYTFLTTKSTNNYACALGITNYYPPLFVKKNGTSYEVEEIAFNRQIAGTRIFQNLSRTMSGTIQTDESITNYRWLLFIWKTNAEYVSELLPSFSNMVAHKSISSGSWDGTNNRFAYNAWCDVAFSGTTGATVTSGYNNSNFQMGIYEIWGIG